MRQLTLFIFALLVTPYAQGQNEIVRYEYWFDDNLATLATVDVAPSTLLDVNTSLPTEGLTNGLHKFSFRVLDNSGKYSVSTSNYFIKSGSGIPGIVAYQYWWDDNMGSASTVSISPQEIVELNSAIDASDIPNGLHRFHIRFKDQSGLWSVPVSQIVYKTNTGSEDNQITAYQFWFDGEVSNAETVEVSPTETLFLSEGLTADLSNGLHKITIRVKDGRQNWSVATSQSFFKIPQGQTPPNGINGYRYWFDDNTANIETVEIGFSANPYLLFEEINMLPLDTGYHVIHLQMRDERNQWSVAVSDTVYNYGEPSLTSITPNQGGNIGFVTVSIYGNGFFDGSVVKLVKEGEEDIVVPDSMMTILNHRKRIVATLNLLDKPLGAWDVIVEIGSADTTMFLEDAFEIVTGVFEEPIASILGPTFVRNGIQNLYTLSFTNSGNVDYYGLPYFLFAGNNAVIDFVNEFQENDNAIISSSAFPEAMDLNDDGMNPYSASFGIIGIIPAGQTVQIPVRISTNSNQEYQLFTTSQLYGFDKVTQFLDCLFSIGETFGVPNPNSEAPQETLGQIYSLFDSSPSTCTLQGNCVTNGIQALGNTSELALQATGNTNYPGSLNYAKGLLKNIREKLNLAGNLYNNYQNCSTFFNTPRPPLFKNVSLVTSHDPNIKFGPDGLYQNGFLNNDGVLDYFISFENDTSATAPAQWIQVRDTLDQSVFDLSSFQPGFISFGDTLISIPPGLQQWSEYVDLRPAQDVVVLVEIDFDDLQGIATWTFTALDPLTYQPVTGALDGFLPPNINQPEGEGSVFYTIDLLEGLEFGTVIKNKAYIYFDNNEPIVTPDWINTLDNALPESQIGELPEYTPSETINVSWGGEDLGAGISNYDIYVSVNDGPYELWLANQTATEAIFFGSYDSTYAFYSVAQDSAGNFEITPNMFDAITTLVNCSAYSLDLNIAGDTVLCAGTALDLTVTGSNEYSWNNGATPSEPQSVSEAGEYFASATFDEVCTINTPSVIVTIVELPDIVIEGDLSLCPGETTLLTATGAQEFVWSGGEITNSISVNESGVISVSGTDVIGCVGTSLPVEVVMNQAPESEIVLDNGLLSALPPGETYAWLFNGEPLTEETGNEILPLNDGNYQVIVTNEFGCIDTSEVFNYNLVYEMSGEIGMNLYPNPNEGTFNLAIWLPVAQLTDVAIFNELGQLVFSKQIYFNEGDNRYEFKWMNLPVGSYTLRANGAAGVGIRQLVIIHD